MCACIGREVEWMSVSSRSSTSVFCRCNPGVFFGGGVDTGVIATGTAAPVRREEQIGLGRSWDGGPVVEESDGEGSEGSVIVIVSIIAVVIEIPVANMAKLTLGVGGVRSILGVPLRFRNTGSSVSKSGVGVALSDEEEVGKEKEAAASPYRTSVSRGGEYERFGARVTRTSSSLSSISSTLSSFWSLPRFSLPLPR